jgi:hypothetical protein
VVVDVQAKQPNGQFQVEIEGQPVVAQSPLPLQPGNRYTLTVARTAAGTIILDTPPPNTPAPQLTQGVVSAILRGLPPSPAPDFARRVQPLLQEIEELPITTPKVVVEAAAAVKKVVDGILPSEPRLLKAEELRTAIRDSGLQQEAKLAQMVEQGDKMVSPRSPVHHDLKTTLLALVESARAVKEIAPALPQALSTLNTIEAAQAVNALNQYQGGAYFVQVPFPEGEEWKTAHLAIEPEYGEDGADGSTSPQFRVLLNVTLTKLGEVWADVSMSDTGLSTVFYLNETSRVQFAEQKQALEAELQAEGFGKTWIDLRSSQDLPERLQKRGMAMKAGTPEFSGLFDFVV